MNTDSKTQTGYYDPDMCDLGELDAFVSRTTHRIDIPNASSAPDNIPIYELGSIEHQLKYKEKRRELMAEWARILQLGAGVLVIKGAQPDHAAIDDATVVYNQIIALEKEDKGGGADHFAAAGSNDRIWNSLQKLCEAAPETFVRYFASPAD